MIGKPKFNRGDVVSFTWEGETLTGKVEIIDAWGTFENDNDCSYDVLCDESPRGECLYKHLPEKRLTAVVVERETNEQEKKRTTKN